MSNYLCQLCAAEFDNKENYRQHKVDHQLGRVGEKKVTELVGGDTLEPIQVESPPTVGPAQAPPKAPWQQPRVVQSPKPIQLQYKYEGNCPDCGGEVDTIKLDNLGGRHKCVVIAMCLTCKKQCQEQIVNKLPVMLKDVTEKSGSIKSVKSTSLILQEVESTSHGSQEKTGTKTPTTSGTSETPKLLDRTRKNKEKSGSKDVKKETKQVRGGKPAQTVKKNSEPKQQKGA